MAKNGEWYDLYYHKDQADGGSVIARFGDDGPEYFSMPFNVIKNNVSGFNDNDPLTIAYFKILEHRRSIIGNSFEGLNFYDKLLLGAISYFRLQIRESIKQDGYSPPEMQPGINHSYEVVSNYIDQSVKLEMQKLYIKAR